MTTRFYLRPLPPLSTRHGLGVVLRAMPAADYLECSDTDAIWLLECLDAHELAVTCGNPLALNSGRLERRLVRLLRAVAKGQGRDFARTPQADDPGLCEEGVVLLASSLWGLCERATGKPLWLLMGYSRRALGLPVL